MYVSLLCRLGPDEWTMIPVLVKIYKLIINELSTQIENSLMQQAEDDDDDDEVRCCPLVANTSLSRTFCYQPKFLEMSHYFDLYTVTKCVYGSVPM